jgi:beta-glucanase (GH16 family)
MRRPTLSSPRHARILASLLVATSVLVAGVVGQPTASEAGDARLVFSDDFDGDRLDPTKWGVYEGTKPGSIRKVENVWVKDGVLTIRTKRESSGRWSAGGVTNARAFEQRYGEYQVRLRVDKGKGVKAVALLWPARGAWPPEIDFFEISNHHRDLNKITVHHGTQRDRKMIHAEYKADFTRWQTVGVRWTPTRMSFTLNGKVKRTISNGVPQERMWLALQSNIGKYVKVDARTPRVVDFQIDWVRIYSL